MSNRNKSSLKPLRREPLQDLQMVSAVNSDEDTTSTITLAALAKRRVSFSGRNSVKEYVPCAEPICVMSTPAYEETFAHLSSDSSCLGNNSGQNDENNMSQTLMAINRPRPSMPLAPPTRVSLNQNTQQQFQKYHNSLPQQQQHQQIAAQDDSLNNSDMCMTEPINSTKLYESSAIDQTVADVSHVAGDMLLTPVVDRAADTSSGDMSFTRAFGRPDKNSTCINFTSAANDTTSQNNSTCMSFTKAIVANNDNFPNDNSMIQNNSMSFTKAIVANDERFSAGLSQNNSTCMSFTKAIVVNDENSQMGNVLSHTSSSQMSFTKAIVVNDENSQMGNVLSQTSSSHMSFTKAMVLSDETDNVLSQNNLSHMSLTKAIVGENVPTDDNVSSQNSSTHMSFTKAIVANDVQNGNASMSFTKAFSAADELKADGNVTMTIDDSVTNFKNATNFTMDPGTDEEMRRLMQEVEMEETLDSEKLKSYRLSDVSFLVRENLVSGKSKRARRRSSIATASSNSPIDLSVTGNRFGQQNIDEEEEEEEEMDVEEEEEEEGVEKELSGREEEVKSSEENGKEGRRLEEGEFEKEDTRNREENCVLGVEEECERERKSEGKDLKEDIERKALEEEENELEEGRQVNLEERRVRELEEERLRKRKGNNDFENVGIEREVEDIGEDVEREDVVDRMETDAEIQSRKDNNADDLDMSIVEDIEEVPNSAKEKDENVKKEKTLHLNLREETVLATSRREETLSKKTEETFCLNLNSVSEMVESSVAREDNEREEAECDEGGVKEDVTGSDKERSADMGSNQSTRSTVVMSAVCKDQPPEQLLQECTRAKRKSDSLDLSREEFDVIESPSKLARMEVPLSPEAPAVTSEEQQSNVTAEIANSSRTRKPRASIGKRHSSSHSLDETRLTFSEMAESLLDASSSLASLDNSSRLSGAFLASINASIPVRYVEEEVAPNETRYSFYGGAVVVRVEAQSGATEQLKVAEVLVDEDADVHCLIFANKTKGLFAEKVLACQSMADVKKAISEINSFVYNHETQHQSLLRLWMNAKLDFVDGRLKYNAVCYDTMTWFSVMMDPDIIFKDLSDDAITVKTCIGDVQESYIKHLYRCCVMSPDRLKHFTDSLEKYVSSSKT